MANRSVDSSDQVHRNVESVLSAYLSGLPENQRDMAARRLTIYLNHPRIDNRPRPVLHKRVNTTVGPKLVLQTSS